MITVPFAVSDTEYSVFVVLQDESLARIKEHDPAELRIRSLPANYTQMRLRDVVIGYATEDEVKALMEPSPDVPALLKRLSRGWRFRPEAGDYDGPYRSAR